MDYSFRLESDERYADANPQSDDELPFVDEQERTVERLLELARLWRETKDAVPGFVNISSGEVHVKPDVVREIANGSAEIIPFNATQTDYAWEISATINGIRFFGLMTDEQYAQIVR